jgi:1,4-alpha-glucan branching enzyme
VQIKTKKNVGAIVNSSGVSFRVWAPFAKSVAVIGSFNNWQEFKLKNEKDGYWSGFYKGAIPGQEYKFVIYNGSDKYIRNDPRSLHITTSAGNSVITGNIFDWGDDNFQPIPIEQQIIYELHVGTFNRLDPSINGTFIDLIDKLDYLAELGINMIEIMPVSSMLMDRGWGYAIDYIFAVETLYGGRYNFLRFIRAAHSKGIGVILDVVYNHFGPDINLDLWNFDGWHEDNMGGIYFYNDWRAETPWGNTRPDFGRPEVQQYILDNVAMWVHDCRVDGLRVDSTIYIRNVKGSNNDPAHDLPEGWQLLQQINSIARKIKPSLLTIAEDVADNDYIVKPIREGGAGFISQWELNFPGVLREALKTNDPEAIDIAGICGELSRRYNNQWLSRVIYTDSHDSAANGSARLNEVISPKCADNLFARQQSLIAATILLTTPGIPMIFQGQEFMQVGEFNDWQGLDWNRTVRFFGIIDAYKYLIALRKNSHNLTAGLIGPNINLTHIDEANKVIAYHRWQEGGPLDDTMVIINFSNRQFDSYELGFPRNGSWKVRFNSTWEGYSKDFKNIIIDGLIVENGAGRLTIPPASALILSQDF